MERMRFPLPYEFAADWGAGHRLALLWACALLGYVLARALFRCIRRRLRDPLFLVGLAATGLSVSYELVWNQIIPHAEEALATFNEWHIIALLLVLVVALSFVILCFYCKPLARVVGTVVTFSLSGGGRLLQLLSQASKKDKDREKGGNSTNVYNLLPGSDMMVTAAVTQRLQEMGDKFVQTMEERFKKFEGATVMTLGQAEEFATNAAVAQQLQEMSEKLLKAIEEKFSWNVVQRGDRRCAHEMQQEIPRPVPISNRFGGLEEEETTETREADDEVDQYYSQPLLTAEAATLVQTPMVRKRTWKATGATPRPRATPPNAQHLQQFNMGEGVQELLTKYNVPNEETLIECLQEKRRRELEVAGEPEWLTIEEKNLETLAQLALWWKKRDIARGLNSRPLTQYDYTADLGPLTPEMKVLSRRELKKIIQQRKKDRWIEDMILKGVQLHKCPTCEELTNDSHRCMATKWSTGKPGPLTQRRIIVKQNPQGITIQPARHPSHEQVQGLYDQSRKHLEEYARIQRLLNPTGDAVMTDATHPHLSPPQVPPTVTITPPSPNSSNDQTANPGPQFSIPTPQRPSPHAGLLTSNMQQPFPLSATTTETPG